MKQELRRLLSALLCMAMLLGMFPALRLFTQAQAAEAEPVHTVHGDHSDWIAVDAAYLESNSFPATGNVVLTGDIDLSEGVAVSGDLHLCLNGYTISAGVGNTFVVASGKTMTLCDCSSEKTGTIDCTAAGKHGLRSAVYSTGGTFVMHGGTITGIHTTSNGGGVYVEGATARFYMYGGTICGNKSTAFGGGVGVNSKGAFYMYGGTIEKNEGARGAGMWIFGGSTAVLAGGSVTENTATVLGAAVYNNAATVKMQDIQITGNVCRGTDSNSSIVYTNGTTEISGGTLTFDGKCTYGIKSEGGNLRISGGRISGDQASTRLVFITGAAATCEISGTPQITAPGLAVNTNVAAPATIGELKGNASVFSATELTVDEDDKTVVTQTAEDGWLYIHNPEDKAHCSNGHGEHTGWTRVDSQYLQTNAFPTSGSVVLTGDITLNDKVVLSGDLHLCLNGYTIHAKVGNAFEVKNNYTMKLCDCSVYETGAIDCTGAGTTSQRSAIYLGNGNLQMYGGKVTGHTTSNNGGGIYAEGTCAIDLYGGEISGNTTTGLGGGVFCNGAVTFHMYGGTISGNTSARGAGLYLNGSAVATIHDGVIKNNKASAYGAAIVNYGQLTIKGGKIFDNQFDTTSPSADIAHAIFSVGKLVIEGGTIQIHESCKDGIRIADANAEFIMTGGSISGKAATSLVFLHTFKSCQISGTAKIGEKGLRINGYDATKRANTTIGNLTDDACVYSHHDLATLTGDSSVLLDGDSMEGRIIYTAKKPVNYGIQLTLDETSAQYLIDGKNLLKVPENTGITTTVSAVTVPSMAEELPSGYTVKWSSADDNIAAIVAGENNTAVITYKNYGTTTITARVMNGEEETEFFAVLDVQVGEDPIRVLAIGNDSSRDGMFYLSKLALLTGSRVQASYLYKKDANLRDHALSMAYGVADYAFYQTNMTSCELVKVTERTSVVKVLADEEWDFVIIQNGTTVGWPTTYNSDVDYLVDYIRDVEPNAELYWNMSWANELGCDTGYAYFDIEYDGTVDSGYAGNPAIMYNAIVDNINKYIPVAENSEDKDSKFDGLILTGTAIQNLRGEFTYVPDTNSNDEIEYNLQYLADDNWTRDGYHLSFKGGRLAAAMTMLKELLPETDLSKITVAALENILVGEDADAVSAAGKDTTDAYQNTAGNLSKIINAVEAASEMAAPEKLTLPKAQPTSPNGTTIYQTTIPVSPRFPDVVTLGDGTLVTCAVLHIGHSTWPTHGLMEGSSSIVVFSGSADGLTWNTDTPLLVIDEAQLEEWGFAQFTDRYARLKANPELAQTIPVASAFGDFNMEVFHMDMDGDPTTGVDGKEEVLFATFWGNIYQQNGSIIRKSCMIWSTDGGQTWSEPQGYALASGSPIPKRGDAAVFTDDRQILLPFYGRTGTEKDGNSGCLLMQWDVANQKWTLLRESLIPRTSADEDTNDFTEVALISPKEDDVVFAMVRCSGAVLKSEDRGQTWTEIANETKRIHQAGFTKLDENHVFVTWSSGWENPRDIYGKVFNVNGDWTDTPTVKIHDYATANQHDTGNPGNTVLKDGRVIVIHYDTEFDSLLANFVDPWGADFLPHEADTKLDKNYFFQEDFADSTLVSQLETTDSVADGMLTLANGVSVKENVTVSHTIDACVVFAAANGTATVKTVAGDVVIMPNSVTAGDESKALSLALNTATNVRISIVGTDLYIKVWQGTEPAAWALVTAGAATEQKTGVYGTNAKLDKLEVSKRFTLGLQQSVSGIAIGSTAQLNSDLVPNWGKATWESSDPQIAPVDQNGVVTFLKEGTATITMTVNGFTANCAVTVEAAPIELSGEGKTNVILEDDFDSYDVGKNTFLKEHWETPEADRLYWFRDETEGVANELGIPRYDIEQDGANRYLAIRGYGNWFMTAAEIAGDYTVQYDFNLTNVGGDAVVYNHLWQNHPDEGNGIWAMANFRSTGMLFGYYDKPLDDPDQSDNPAKNYPADGSFSLAHGYEMGEWFTVKMTRINGALFVKFWPQGQQEPAQWNHVLYNDVLDTSVASHYRLQTIGNAANNKGEEPVLIDNLKITQQVESPVEATRMHLGNSLNMQFAVPMDQQADWTGAYAEIVRGNQTTTVPFIEWSTLNEENLYVVPFQGVAAKAMTDEVTVTIFDKDGNQIGESYTDSIRDYAMRILGNEEKKTAWTMMVDMLNYGAAAQEFFGYKTEDLANAKLTAAQKDLATKQDVAVSDGSEEGTVSRLKLENNIELQIVVPEGKTISYTFTHHGGDTVSVDNATVLYDATYKKHYIVIEEIVVADAFQQVEVKADGNVIAQDSVASYIARIDAGETANELYQLIMKFASSAKTYFATN